MEYRIIKNYILTLANYMGTYIFIVKFLNSISKHYNVKSNNCKMIIIFILYPVIKYYMIL